MCSGKVGNGSLWGLTGGRGTGVVGEVRVFL